MDIQTLWEIVQKGGAIGILFITNIMLWMKLDKKEKELNKLTAIIEKSTIHQTDLIRKVEKVSDNLIELIGALKR